MKYNKITAYSLALILSGYACTVSYAQDSNSPAETLPESKVLEAGELARKLSLTPVTNYDFAADQMFNTLAAEMYKYQGDLKTAAEFYTRALSSANDENLARVATESAAQTGRLDDAIANAKRWLQIGKDPAEATQYLALLLLRAERYEESVAFVGSMISLESHKKEAMQAFEAYVKKYNDTPPAHLKLAEVAFEQQNYSKALQKVSNLKSGLALKELEKARVLRGKALHRLGKAEEASAIMEALVDDDTVSDVTRLEYARLLMLAKKDKQAINQMEAIHKNAPENMEILRSLIALHISVGQFTHAEVLVKKFAGQENHQDLANHFMAEIHESRNELDQALKAYREVGEGDYFVSAQRRVAELLVEQYGTDVALDWLTSQRKEKSKLEYMYWQLQAEVFSKYKKFEVALPAFEKAHQMNPNAIDLNYTYALAAQEVGKVDQAEQLLRAILRRNESSADALNALGFMLLEKTDRVDEAGDYIKQAHELRPKDPAIIDSLGWFYFKKGDLEKAYSYLSEAYAQMDDPEIAGHLIEVLISKGDKDVAKEMLAKMIKQYPQDKRLQSIQKKIDI